MANMIRVAIYDNDYKIREIKKYKIAQDGDRISIVNSGAGKFMPYFDNSSYLLFPSWKKWLFFGPRSYKELYVVKNGAESCVNFYTGRAVGPSIEEKKKANLGALANNLSQGAGLKIPWHITVILVLLFGCQLIIMKVLGVF